MRKSLASLVASATLLALPSAQAADEVTTCPMGSPTPGFRVVRLELPEGSDFLTITPHGLRQQRGASGDQNWHLAEGIFVVNADTLDLEAYRVEAIGVSPRRLVVRADGTQVISQETTAPDGPFYHTAQRPRAGLAPGTYYVIGFGSDGGTSLPNEWWSVDVRVSGKHACTPIGTGTIFDIDHTEFSGGTQIYAHVAGIAMDNRYALPTPAGTDLVVGLMDASVQGPGEATIGYQTPLASGDVIDEIVPFVSIGGEHRFTGSFQGSFPMLLIAGVAIDLP